MCAEIRPIHAALGSYLKYRENSFLRAMGAWPAGRLVQMPLVRIIDLDASGPRLAAADKPSFCRYGRGMRELWEQIVADWPTGADMVLVTFRLLLAIVVGALPGLQRERLGLPAGLRTHILVSLGAAVFMLAALEAGASMSDTTRVIQGLATGIGFVGTGAILKSVQRQEVKGLTTAASIWAAAALGTAVGAGRIWLPLLGSVLTLFVLAILRQVEPTTEQDGYRRGNR